MGNCWMISYIGYMACKTCYLRNDKFPQFNNNEYIGFSNETSPLGYPIDCEYWGIFDYTQEHGTSQQRCLTSQHGDVGNYAEFKELSEEFRKCYKYRKQRREKEALWQIAG